MPPFARTDRSCFPFIPRVFEGPLFLGMVVAGLLWTGCGDEGDLEGSPAGASSGVVLTRESHPEGWGLGECLLCHPVFRIHRSTENPEVDLDEIREVVAAAGEESCMFCHGSNGT